MKNRDRAEIICMVGTRYSNLLQKEGSQRSSQPLEQAFFSSESDGRSGARRGRGRGHGVTQSRGRGGCSGKLKVAVAEEAAAVPVMSVVVATVVVADL